LATAGADGRFMFWDKDARTKLKNSEQMQKQITKCDFHGSGNIFAYATGYDWSKVCFSLQTFILCNLFTSIF
jgi:mRNA export factor